ncbi:DUF3313 domain-containing protein [Endozoicomonas numazuensis]|uniref:Lipoprotein n=1 Tax=Endozoicomonas numazuensis TaxID=1137799 RepID=A0A081N114_9GAMM|nr:DUF3313 domain-containing protein [Endozoicomonas numazuensis]KEQ12137.1 hypothetical protein GZ78_28310 [Endozoicomonas numazuensis]
MTAYKKTRRLLALPVVLISALLLTACSTQQKIDTEEQPYSGYLEHYEKLTPIDDDTAMRWVSGDLKKYKKVYVEPIKLFPNYNATNDAQREVATKVADYLNNGFKEGLKKRGMLAEKPGPGVLVIQPAITGIVSEMKDLKPRQFVLPVAVARTLIKTATDRLDYIVALYMEVQLRDGGTGKLEGEVLRKGINKQSDNDEVTKEDVKAVLDDWLEFYNRGLDMIIGKEQ